MDSDAFRSLFDLSGRSAIITGGTRGIGRSIAEGLACAGARVVVASRSAESCAAAEERLTEAGFEALGVPTHMGNLEAVEALAAAAVDRFGGVDVLVNNAANALAQPIGAQTPVAWQKSFEVNLRGPALLTQACLPQLELVGPALLLASDAGRFITGQVIVADGGLHPH